MSDEEPQPRDPDEDAPPADPEAPGTSVDDRVAEEAVEPNEPA